MEVSNFLTYEGRLECAHESVATATVTLGSFSEVLTNLKQNPNDEWLVKSLHPETSVMFLDTSKVKQPSVLQKGHAMKFRVIPVVGWYGLDRSKQMPLAKLLS